MVVVSEVSKYLKDRRKDKTCKKIVVEGFIGCTTLVCDGPVMLCLSAEESARVFVRRDDWPKVPAIEGQSYIYGHETEAVAAKDPYELANLWAKYNDLLKLTRFDLSSWIQILPDGMFVHLLRVGGHSTYLDASLVGLVTSTPHSLKYFGTTPDKPILLTDSSGNPVAVIKPAKVDDLAQLPTPDDAEAGFGEK